MTIAISLKVNDGLVLAADSASTLFQSGPTGSNVVNVYNNANKVFNLRKGFPIGALTWGSGGIGNSSISTLLKDLRRKLTGEEPDDAEWKLENDGESVKNAANHLRNFIRERYDQAFRDWPTKPPLGFVVGGYSMGSSMAEEYILQVEDGTLGPPKPLRELHQCGMSWNGEGEAIHRLALGFSPHVLTVLQQQMGVPPEQLNQVRNVLASALNRPLIQDAMPIQDAIDLAEFFVDLTCKYSRFTPGAGTVGGPVEVAAITKHEGFRWVQRKYYFSRDLNPEEMRND